ncbi:MAG: MurT ligase domain-containing protein [Candidatus Saccharimonadales bacterium]
MPKPPLPLTTLLGKAVREVAKLRGGGSALPGLFVESIDKDFIRRCLEQLPEGVVVISGTNGKTTTTKMVVELLEGQGLKVFTNRTGSNFTRGVAAALLGSIDNRGTLDADIAVLELDEAHAVHFVSSIKPRFSLLLNVMRDQLDRFGEIDTTARMLNTVAEATSGTVVANREDPRLLSLSRNLPTSKVKYFGLESSLRKMFPNDDELRGASERKHEYPEALCILEKLVDQTATFSIEGKQLTANLKLQGIYNVFNAVAAVSLVRVITGDAFDVSRIVESLETITPAFGRGEKLLVDNQPLELVLVKNPGGFRLALESFDPSSHSTMIAINDNYADGRDMSWLWDVDFKSLSPGISHVSGVRAYDMALRLQYDEIVVGSVETDLKRALATFIQGNKDMPKRIYCTYTAMLSLRRELAKITEIEAIS